MCLCELYASVCSCTHWGSCAASSAAQSAWRACTSLWMGFGVAFAARPRPDVYTIQQVWVWFVGSLTACLQGPPEAVWPVCSAAHKPGLTCLAPCLAWPH